MTGAGTKDLKNALNAIQRIVRAQRINTRYVEKRAGISLAQLQVLKHLAEQPADSLNELAERTGTHQSSVSVVASRLVDAGLIVREATPTDRRRIRFAITRAGRVRLAAAPVTVQEQLEEAATIGLADSEVAILACVLGQWVDAANLDGAAQQIESAAA